MSRRGTAKYIKSFDHRIDPTESFDAEKAKKAGVSKDTYVRFKKNLDKIRKIKKNHLNRQGKGKRKSTVLDEITKLHPDLNVRPAKKLKKRSLCTEKQQPQPPQPPSDNPDNPDNPDMTGLSGPALYRCGGHGMIQWVEDHVRIPIYVDDIPYWISMAELPIKKNPHTGRSSADFWNAQKPILKEALRMANNKFIYRLIVLCWMRGDGKCAAKGSKVLMYNGGIKKVEDVRVGDLLMGDDGTPRKVLSLAQGVDEMFKITPWRGEPLTVNEDHILSLKTRCMSRRRAAKRYNGIDSHENEIIDISLRDYMKESKYFKRKHLLFKVPVTFPEQEVSIDPYFLGLWLGDGSSNNTGITTMDPEVVQYIEEYAAKLGLKVTSKSKSIQNGKENKAGTYHIVGERSGVPGSNFLLTLLQEANLIKNKYIPKEYKCNSREIQLQILAGLLDSDGYLNRNSFSITQKNRTLLEDIAFIARSLGFFVVIKTRTKTIKALGFTGEYHIAAISGDCSIIPTRIPRKRASKRMVNKDILVSEIKSVESVGQGEYYGFNLDGNGRYLTDDFTVTHNSLLACLIQLWKFFNFPRQQIMLGANSKDQVKFVHFDIMRDIILNSPKLLRIVGKKNVQEKEIRLRDGKGNIVSIVRSISSFSGIVSNITGYTFSEIFDMKNPKFFTQLDGSIRNIPNALGVIDSTVSAKDHVLFRLYDNSRRKIDELTYFSYRSSPEASAADYWHPEMTQSQLNSYKTKFPPAEFDMYFKNVWESASHKMFLPEQITAMKFIGVNGQLGDNEKILRCCKDSTALQQKKEKLLNDGNEYMYKLLERKRDPITMCDSIESVYTLQTSYLQNKPASLEELHALEDLYDTHFVIGAGVDRADPMKINVTRGARTIVCIIAKGLPGSRTHPELYMQKENQTLRYFYFLLGLYHIPRNDLASIQEVLDESIDQYDGIEALSTERWGMWDIADWCVDNNIYFDPVTASYMKQKEGYAELFTLLADGRFKAPPLSVPGTNGEDILREEMAYFDHDPLVKFYGSPEKNQPTGVQDDSMFALNWGIYGMRFLGLDYMRERGSKNTLSLFFENKELEGIY